MEAGARQFAIPSANMQAASFIAADVGGTHARVGLVRIGADAHPVVEKFARYACAEYPSLAAILKSFLDSVAGESVLIEE